MFGHSSLPMPSPPAPAPAAAATVARHQLPLSSSSPTFATQLTVIEANDSDHYSYEESARSALLTPNEGNHWYRSVLLLSILNSLG
jgi:hypothetical protein